MAAGEYRCRAQFSNIPVSEGIKEIYERLYENFGPQDWWPGDTPFEIIVGAILTQAVNWRNVEMAIDNLQQADILHPRGIKYIEREKLAAFIKPTGYYNMKARKIKAFVNYFFENYQGDIDLMFSRPQSILRKELLQVYGIGPETADSILLYAGNYPMFVIDAYTRRIFSRSGYIDENISYEKLQLMITDNIPIDVDLYNEYHALLVKLGKDICRKRNPICNDCPIGNMIEKLQ